MNSDSRSSAGTAADWRAPLLAGITLRPAAERAANRLGWPDYDGRSALRWGEGMIVGIPAVAAVWDFTVHGGSFGEADAAAFAAAAATALATRRPLVSLLRSGGTRLQEGVAGLVGLPRAALALAALDDAGIGHLAVADQPTTGGVWVTIGSRGDLRCAITGATVGFTGPRVVEAMTGTPPPAESHRAASALAAGLVDAMPTPDTVADWLRRALTALAPPALPTSEQPARPKDPAPPGDPAAPSRPTARTGAARTGAARTGWEQVRAARTA
ncbi:carboxyl transferase domain-containing protein, partial [Frankia sp. AgKG'84/4]|uniref:carboxyl transferase domain-containing protein n=1 Tax=Frankia sp. AgKG'84/4 TaxID=573490 RepID=UPI0025428C0B